LTRKGYATIAKPLLFKQLPDTVHHRLIQVGKVIQRIPAVSEAPRLWSHQSPRLETTVAGVRFRNPIGLSAGFDKNVDMVPIMRGVGFGFMTGGSVTALPCNGNPRPWFYRLPQSHSLVVHAGLPNQGVERVVQRIVKYPKRMFIDFPLSVSVAKTNSKETVSDSEAIDDYCTSLRRLKEENAGQMYEINISCPNTYGGQPFTTPDRLDGLLTMVDQIQLDKPLFIKMPISQPWRELRGLLEVILRHRVQGVAIGNLLHTRDKSKLKDELPDSVKGNLSGEPTRQISTELIRKTYLEYGDKLAIIGIGGVFTAEDAFEKIRAGASLVALITGMIFEGPQVVGDINAGLEQLLGDNGFASVSEAVGTGAKK